MRELYKCELARMVESKVEVKSEIYSSYMIVANQMRIN